jgi:predicted TIM-barrel fold metal-dependent hydrolase
MTCGDPVADLEAARSLGFTDTELAAVLHGNAAALLDPP